MHEFYVYVLRGIRIALAYIKVSENLLPDPVVHYRIVLIKITKKFAGITIFAPRQGN